MNYTKIILEQKKPSISPIYIGSWIFSIFSIFSSLSIVKQLYKQGDNIALSIYLTLFIVLFLIYNEYIKVRELRRMFVKEKYSLFIVSSTIFISLSLSVVGIYFWTNSTIEKSILRDQKSIQSIQGIDNTLQHKIDSINALNIQNLPEYQRIMSDISFWKNRSAMSGDDKININNNISKLQDELSELRGNFSLHKKGLVKQEKAHFKKIKEGINIHKNIDIKKDNVENFISIMFICMIIVIEILIVFLANEYSKYQILKDKISSSPIAKEFKARYAALTDILTRKGKIEINDIKYSPFLQNKKARQEDKFFNSVIKPTYGLFIELKITEGDLTECQQKLTNYYGQLFSLTF